MDTSCVYRRHDAPQLSFDFNSQQEVSEMNVTLIGIDLAKSVFQVCAVNQNGKLVFNRTIALRDSWAKLDKTKRK